ILPPPDPLHGPTIAGPMARAHLDCARLARNHQHWPSGTVSTEQLRHVHDGLTAAGIHHLALASLRDLTEELLGKRRQPRYSWRVLFPLVWEVAPDRWDGLLVQFVLERLDGVGDVFLDPRHAFLQMDRDFSDVLRHAPAVLRGQGLCTPDGDVRVRI